MVEDELGLVDWLLGGVGESGVGSVVEGIVDEIVLANHEVAVHVPPDHKGDEAGGHEDRHLESAREHSWHIRVKSA